MKKGFLTLLLLLITALPALAAPTNTSGPWGIDISTFTSLSTAKRSPVTAGKNMVVTSVMNCNNLTIPADRSVEVKPGGRIRYAGHLHIAGPFSAGNLQCLEKVGSGYVTFGFGSLRDGVSVAWGGGKDDNSTDSTAALQWTADVIANSNLMTQTASVNKDFALSTMLLGPGSYKITNEIKLHGGIFIKGNKAAGDTGSRILQYTLNKNIFTQYGDLYYNQAAPFAMDGVTLAFATSGATTGYGYATSKKDDTVTSRTLYSNSIYITNSKFGGAYNPYGGFIKIDHGDDFVYDNNIVDVASNCAVVLGDGGAGLDADNQVTNASITNSGFYMTSRSVCLQNVMNLVGTGNRFFYSTGPGGNAWRLSSGLDLTTPRISNILLSNNEYYKIPVPLYIDGSASDVKFTNSKVSKIQEVAIDSAGVVKGLDISHNSFSSDPTAPNVNNYLSVFNQTAAWQSPNITNNRYDFTGVTAKLMMTQVVLPMFTGEATLSGNKAESEASTQRLMQIAVPMAAISDGVKFIKTLSTGFNAINQMFIVGDAPLASGDNFSLIIDYQITISNASDSATITGSTEVAASKNGLNQASVVTPVSSINSTSTATASDKPTVVFSAGGGTPNFINYQVTSTLPTPTTMTINATARAIRGTVNMYLKPA